MKKSILCIAIMFLTAGVSYGGSLWNDNANWYGDDRPSRIGDIVNVLVDERTNAKDEAEMSVTKNVNNQVGNQDGVDAGLLNFIRRITFQSSNSSSGNGSVERTHRATATMSCLVTEVLPNGNLVIEGTRDVRTSDETLQLQLTGVIRPQDVNADNEIPSELIANAEISVKGRGIITRTQRVGVITQILQTVF